MLVCKSYSFSHLTDLLWSHWCWLQRAGCQTLHRFSKELQTMSRMARTDERLVQVVPSIWQQTSSLQRWGMCMFTGTYCGNMSGLCVCGCVCTQTFTVLHMSCVLVIQQYRKMRQHERWMQFSPVLRGREMVTQRRVGTCRGQQSPRCCSWLFPGWDLQPWVTCPADTQGRGVPGHTSHTCVHWAAANSIRVCVTWKTSVWLGLGCVCCSPACWEWCWFCHWDQTSLGRPWNWAPLWLLSPDTSGHTRSQGEEIQTLTSFLWHLIRWLFCYKQSTV